MTDEYDKPSKSARKRSAHELEDLGVKLIALSDRQLAELELPERLLDAINAARQIRSHGALRRQYQYIGKIMRDIDADPIRAAVADLERHHRRQADNLHDIERWRDALLHSPTESLAKFADEFPAVDIGTLRQLVNNAKQNADNEKASKAAARILFRFLRDALPGNADESQND